MSTTRNVSIIGSMTSSGILTSLLFWMLSVSNEFKFSKAIAGKLLMLRDERGKIVENYKNSFSLTRENGSKQIYVISMQNALFVHSLFEPTFLEHQFVLGDREKNCNLISSWKFVCSFHWICGMPARGENP